MHSLTLSLSERCALEKQIRETKDVKVLKRSQALLWLIEGISVQEISQRLGISRQTIYDWVSLYQNRRNQSFKDRLYDRPKPGRSPKKTTLILRELDTLLHESPKQYGYHHTEWTASLLGKVLQREHGIAMSSHIMSGSALAMLWHDSPPRGLRKKGAQKRAEHVSQAGDSLHG